MSKLNENEVKEVARMQSLIDKYEQVINALYIQAKTGNKADFVLLPQTDLKHRIKFLCKFISSSYSTQKNVWHSWREKPSSARILYTSTDEDYTEYYVGDYYENEDRFEPDDEAYYRGKWENVRIKQWAYIDDLV